MAKKSEGTVKVRLVKSTNSCPKGHRLSVKALGLRKLNSVSELKDTPEAREPEPILRKCVHCGFCTPTCPTYQVLGDELDGPRGRIYLIKQMLEGEQPTQKTQLHLDRCLTCRNCESTCPSGVEYGHLVDIGRRIVEEKVPRGASSNALRTRGSWPSGVFERSPLAMLMVMPW